MAKYDITVELSDGNAWAVTGAVTGALKDAKVPKEEVDKCRTELMSGDYDNLLQVAMKWVNVELESDEDDYDNELDDWDYDDLDVAY